MLFYTWHATWCLYVVVVVDVVVVERLLDRAHVAVGVAQVAVRVGEVRVDADRLEIMRDRLELIRF